MRTFALAAALLAATAGVAQTPFATAMAPIKGADGRWDYASVDPVNHRLYVARGDGVMMADLNTGAVNDHFVPGDRVHAAFASPDGKLLMTTNGTTDDLRFFDAQSGAPVATVKVGKKPDAAINLPARGGVAVANADGGTISIVDIATRKVLSTITIGGALEFMAVDGQGKLWVNVEDRNELAEVDVDQGKVLRRTKLTGCDSPSGLAYLAHTGVLLSACANGVAVATRASDGVIAATYAIGPRPDAVLLDASRSRAFIPSGGDGTLSGFDFAGAATTALGRVATAKGARTGAIDETTGRIYLPTVDSKPAAPGARGDMVPGSFRVLVLAQSK